jgi:hypothetical protein
VEVAVGERVAAVLAAPLVDQVVAQQVARLALHRAEPPVYPRQLQIRRLERLEYRGRRAVPVCPVEQASRQINRLPKASDKWAALLRVPPRTQPEARHRAVALHRSWRLSEGNCVAN